MIFFRLGVISDDFFRPRVSSDDFFRLCVSSDDFFMLRVSSDDFFRLRVSSDEGEAGQWQPDKMGDYLINGTTSGRSFYRWDFLSPDRTNLVW